MENIRGFRSNYMWIDEEWRSNFYPFFNEPKNVLHKETLVSIIKNYDTPSYVKLMAPYFDWLFSFRSFDRDIIQFLERQIDQRMQLESRSIIDLEKKAARYFIDLHKDRQRVKELYRLFEDI